MDDKYQPPAGNYQRDAGYIKQSEVESVVPEPSNISGGKSNTAPGQDMMYTHQYGQQLSYPHGMQPYTVPQYPPGNVPHYPQTGYHGLDHHGRVHDQHNIQEGIPGTEDTFANPNMHHQQDFNFSPNFRPHGNTNEPAQHPPPMGPFMQMPQYGYQYPPWGGYQQHQIGPGGQFMYPPHGIDPPPYTKEVNRVVEQSTNEVEVEGKQSKISGKSMKYGNGTFCCSLILVVCLALTND